MTPLSPENLALIGRMGVFDIGDTYVDIQPADLDRLLDAARAEGHLQGRAEKEAEIGMHLICVGEGTDPQLTVRGHQPAIEAVQAIIGDHQATMAELNRLKAQMSERRTETVTIDGVEYFGRLVGGPDDDRLQLYQITEDGERRIKGRPYADLAIKYLAALRLPS